MQAAAACISSFSQIWLPSLESHIHSTLHNCSLRQLHFGAAKARSELLALVTAATLKSMPETAIMSCRVEVTFKNMHESIPVDVTWFSGVMIMACSDPKFRAFGCGLSGYRSRYAGHKASLELHTYLPNLSI